MKRISFLLLALAWLTVHAQSSLRPTIRLDGTWQLALDPEKKLSATSAFTDFVELPGTTDTNRKGLPPASTDETTHLTRLHSYVGRAWYRRKVNVPASWKGRSVRLFMERTKPTEVYVDGHLAGKQDAISTPQEYDLTEFMKPGDHDLCIMVDNSEESVPPQVVSNSHAYTEDTQTNWNGIIGQLFLESVPTAYISHLTTEGHASTHVLEMTVELRGRVKKPTQLRFILVPWGSDYGVVMARQTVAKSNGEPQRYRVSYQDDGLELWSEFHPNLYRVRVELEGTDMVEQTVGLCDFTTQGTQFAVNGHTTFLRGKHDACVFPLRGHTPMDVEDWRHYFQVCRGYGINHVRFHSWCPPDACFTAADIEGVYLQPELPFWGDFNKDDTRLMSFLIKEGQQILQQYGHHPSFVMMALGNELWGDIPTMKLFTDTFRRLSPRKLYTFGSNYYLGYQGWKEGMDYFTTCRNGGEAWGSFNTHTRASFSFADTYDGGLLNHAYPNSATDFSQGIAGVPVPVVGHETAQFQTYPDFDEIGKYRGVLYPYNLEVFRRRLEQAGMADQASDFHRASGLWSMQLYKADIEMALRTEGFGGFQLLDLQDYPGQGSAYVGVLDAFMESKGLTTPEEFRQACSPVVPLLVTDKFCYSATEHFQGALKLADYAEPPATDGNQQGELSWQLLTDDGRTLQQGSLPIGTETHGLSTLGNVDADLSVIDRATRLTMVLKARRCGSDSTWHTNRYPLWVYPEKQDTDPGKDIVVSHRYDAETARRVSSGATVLLMPDTTQMEGLTVGGLFQTDYWNFRMFKTISENNHKPVSPGTLGLLCNPQHPLLADFPTDMHTSWQWFPVVKASRPFMLDNTAPGYRPIVQVIDNIERNHKLGLIFEFAVGRGRLLVCMSPLDQLTAYPEARQLYASILAYMRSDHFRPQTHVGADDLQKLFTTPVAEGKIGELNNISPY